MNILYLTHYTGLYGANKSLLEVIINMQKIYNVKPMVITPGTGEFNKKLDKLNIENYSFKFYPWISFNNNKIKSFIKYFRYKVMNRYALNQMLLQFNKEDISIVHTNSSCIDIGCALADKLNIKHIWHIREFGEEDYNIMYYKGIKKACEYMNKKSSKIVFISKALKNKYNPYFNDKGKLSLIYNGIMKEEYFIDISEKDFNSEFNILFTGLICKSKNQFELVKAINLLVNKRNIKNIKAYFLGDGDELYINQMKNFIIEKNLDSNIQFEGRVENVKEYIQESHVGVISSYKEAFGRVTVEYMFGGLTVIASDTGANAEIITDKEDGLIYDLGNIQMLANKIEHLYKNREELRKLSFEGQKTVIAKFTSDINCKNIYRLYKSVLDY